MKVYVERQEKNLDMAFKGKASELLEKLKINQEEVIVVKNKSVVTTDEILNDKDEVEIISVVSGG